MICYLPQTVSLHPKVIECVIKEAQAAIPFRFVFFFFFFVLMEFQLRHLYFIQLGSIILENVISFSVSPILQVNPSTLPRNKER